MGSEGYLSVHRVVFMVLAHMCVHGVCVHTLMRSVCVCVCVCVCMLCVHPGVSRVCQQGYGCAHVNSGCMCVCLHMRVDTAVCADL